MKGWFVTGTDTGVGKTLVSAALLRGLNAAGHRALGMKPIASGCARTVTGLRSPDAERLRQAGTEAAPYADVNPYAYEPPVAPHLAAEMAGETIDLDVVVQAYVRLRARADVVVVEGVGGWCVPLGSDVSVADLAVRLALPVILVVGMRLGCLNHALLTGESIVRSGLPFAGWVANCIDPGTPLLRENVAALRERLRAPLLGTIPFLAEPDPAAAPLDLVALRVAAD